MINLNQNNKGFSLVEMMITLAISAIIIGAAFGSYTIIARNYDWQTDMKYMSQSARTIVNMIQKDIRNAGFRFESQAAISDPITIYDAGDCCDRIEIIYDETESKRIKIEYRLQQYSNDNTRFRLYKKKTNMTNNTLEFDSPIADYVEALQFTGSKGDCSPGAISYGCGTIKKVTPISATWGTNGSSTCSDNALEIFDGDVSTYWDCRSPEYENSGRHYIRLAFAEDFRPTKLVLNGSLGGLSGGSFNLSLGEQTTGYQSDGSYDLLGAIEPWGTNHSIGMIFRFRRDGQTDQDSIGDGWTCVWKDNTYCQVGEFLTGNIYSHMYAGDRGSSPNHWLGSNPHSFQVQPVSTITFDLEETNTQHDGHLFTTSSKWLTILISDRARYCDYSEGHCDLTDGGGRFITIPDMEFYGETWGDPPSPQEIELGLLLRSPNEHGNIDREESIMIGNYNITKNDKYLRDSYTTSATARNMLYQSQ